MKSRFIIVICIAIVISGLGYFYSHNAKPDISGATTLLASPRISPDYTGIVMPPNCAPLNFIIQEPAANFFVDIYGKSGKHIACKSSKGTIQIPQTAWKKLLTSNKGSAITFDVYTKEQHGTWKRFAPIVNTIAKEDIDRYMVYRLMPPLYTMYGEMGIYQRDLSSFAEKPLWRNRMSEKNCMNCHTFKHNDPDFFVAHMRGGAGNGTLIKQGNKICKINTATDFNKPAGYPSWHPSGEIVSFSVNTVRQFFHATGNNREGFDKGSKIILYHIATNTISTTPPLCDPLQMPTQPEWSPDGKFLYYCTTPQIVGDSISKYHSTIFYDLCRIAYSIEKDTWGVPEIILSHETTKQSISFPRVSPDGRYILFCLSAFGTFPVFRPGGDLYILDVQSKKYNQLNVNSIEPESFPRWSSNGRWFSFSSKRIDGICARPYFSYFDTNGNASKPFILPQKNPDFYASFLKTYNLPELITKPFTIRPQALVRSFYDNKHIRNAKLSPELIALQLQKKKSLSPDNAVLDAYNNQQNKATTH